MEFHSQLLDSKGDPILEDRQEWHYIPAKITTF